jgi:porin
MSEWKALTNPWLHGVVILTIAGLLTLLLPEDQVSGPTPAEAKTGHGEHHAAPGSGYGIMRYSPSTTFSRPATTAPVAPASQPVAEAPAPVEPTTSPAVVVPPASSQPSTAPTSQASDMPATTQSTQPSPPADVAAAGGDANQHLSDTWLADERGKLADRGIVIDALLAMYAGQNFMGGATTSHGGAAYEFNLNFTMDSKKLAGYDGGTLFVNFRTQDGLKHSLDGSFGNTSHLYEPQLTTVTELWYQQTLLDDKLRLKLGKIDANADFAFVQNGGEFLNDFASYSATILAFPTDPDPALGALAFYTINDHISVGIGTFDGSLQQGVSTGALGPNTGFHSSFLISEADATWTLPGSRDGRLALGVWRHSGSIDHLDNAGHDNSAVGPYVTLDQTLWRTNPNTDGDKQGLAMFALAGYADPRISQAAYQCSTGVKWTGLLASRPNDVVGLGAGYIGFSQAVNSGSNKSGETTFETFYKIELNPWFSIEPDFQYVIDPGGVSGRPDAFLGTVQILADF